MNTEYRSKYFLFGLLLLMSSMVYGQFQSSILHYDDSLRLVYHSDVDGNRIPDFSHAGYKNGGIDLPELAVIIELDPISGDNTAQIQSAINQVTAMPLDENGFRGAVLLKPGLFPVNGTIYIKGSGVVLRGSGEGDDPSSNTIIQGMGTDRRTLVVIGYGSNSKWGSKSGSNINITSKYIPVGSRTFEVADASTLSVGDNIVIRHPSTDSWLAAIDYGATHGDVDWLPGEIDMYFNRFITQIEGNKIKVDAPVYHELDRSLSQSYVYIYTRDNLVTESGIENLRIDIQTSGPLSENHVWNGIDFIRVEDCWAKNVTVLHFGKSGFWLEEATRSTILNCSAIKPHSEIEPPDRYNFYLGEASNSILFKNCHASEARHAFVSNGTSSVAGIVFTNCSSVDEYTSSEGHRRWGEALLWDNTSFNSNNTYTVLGLYNRGNWGTGHGWTGTNHVAWNVSAPNNQIIIQKPPIGQNYAIGCSGDITNVGPFNPHEAGWIEGTGETLIPESLYEAQLSERIQYGVSPDAPGRLKPIGYLYTDTSKCLDLEWLDIALDENHYVLERSSDGATTFEVLDTLAENIEFYSDTSLFQENYHYRLKAVNDIGSSAYSNIVQSMDYEAPDTIDITFRVNMSEITNLYEGGDVRLTFGDWDSWYLMTDDNSDNIYEVTVSVLEETELKYFFGYQTGPDPDVDYSQETVHADCSDADGYRRLSVTDVNLIVVLPAVLFGSCDEAMPEGDDITDLPGTNISGSNDNEVWISATEGSGSPAAEGISNLIDNNVNTKYLVRDESSWIQVSSNRFSKLTGYTITSANDAPTRDPKNWELLGFDAISGQWLSLHSVVNNPVWEDRLKKRGWIFVNDESYSKYRLNITAINGDPQSLMQMAELELIGEIGDFTTVEEIIATSVSIYPNPAGDFVRISGISAHANYRVYNIVGKDVLRGRVFENGEINIHNLAEGIYFLKLDNGLAMKFIKK